MMVVCFSRVVLVAVLLLMTSFAHADWHYLQARMWYPDSNLNLATQALYIRGDSLGLNWGKGIIMNHDAKSKNRIYFSVESL